MAATMMPRDGSLSARGGLTGSRKLKASMGTRNTEFLRLVERTEDAFTSTDDTAVEDVRRILADVRTQYDHVHMEAERREAELSRLREAIRVADQSHSAGAAESFKREDARSALEKHYKDTMSQIKDAQTARKVYTHMCNRIQKEQALLKEKLLVMEAHLERKGAESHRKVAVHERLVRKGAQTAQDLDVLEQDMETERAVRDDAQRNMKTALQSKMVAKERRTRFDEWRREVALDAANEAFNASAGRLRKLYAVEKLAGNCLQKITFEQVERSQTTEDGFQKIREVTGLTDVMDIVHKFLNRDVEHEQLKGSVKEAEERLEALRSDFDAFKRDTEGITFDQGQAGGTGGIYKDMELSERGLNDAMEEHEACRARLQRITLQTEHMKRWSLRVGQLLSPFEEPVRVEGPQDLAAFFRRLEVAVERFVAAVAQQISDGKITRRELLRVMKRDFEEQERALASKDFLQLNCRVPAAADAPGRAASRQGTAEDDPASAFADDRERWKRDSTERSRQGQAEQQKKRPKGQ
mmetsp:Transcript_28960/g.90252  ORF Transcript_28960/g.90252 Transcript_28960/m.90252 type:complete len:526 (-) Transcript_28960:30-1607(-)